MWFQDPPIKVSHLASGDLWAGAEVMVGVMLEALAARPECQVSAILLNAGQLEDRLCSLRIPVRVFPESRLGVVGLFRAIAKELHDTGCDILHTHRYKENTLGALASSYAGVPVCIRTVHGSPEPFQGLAGARMAVYLWLDCLIQKYFNDRVIVVAEYLKSEMRSWLPEEKLAVIHNGVPEGKVAITRETDRQDRFVVGWAGRMVPAKSLDVLLQAVARARTRIPFIKLQLAGDGPEAERLDRLAVLLGLKDVVEFCGFVRDISDFLCTLDVLVLPSSQEGLPVVLLEAMRAGVPVVASSVGGIPEIVAHRRSGILVPPGDVSALAAALEEMANDAVLRDLVREGAKATVSDRFSSQRLGAELICLYNNLLVCKKRPAAIPSAHSQ